VASKSQIALRFLFVYLLTIAGFTPSFGFDTDDKELVAKPSAQARHLAAKVVDAYGGIDKIKNLNELMYTAKGAIKESSMISGAENSFDCQVFAKGDKTRVELNILGQSVVTGYNGSQSWVKQGDNVFPTDPTTAKRIQLEVEHGLKLLERMTDKDAFVALGEPKLVDGKEFPSLLVKAIDGRLTRFIIDPATNLIIRSEYSGTDLEQGLHATKANDYSDYRPVFGTQLPYTTIEYNDDKKSAETSLSDIELVPNGNDSIFDMPIEIPLARLSQGPIKFPFEFRANEIIIKSTINGKSNVCLIVDTGATTTVLNAPDATTFGATKSTDYKMTTGSGTIKTGYTTLSSLSLGDLTLSSVPVAISELPGLHELPGQKPVGIIGADILRRFLVVIDFENREISLSDPHNVTVPPDATVIPTEPALGAAGLIVQGKLDGQPITLLVDTGAAFNNISEKLVQKIIKPPLLPVGKVEGLDGQKISIGAVMFKNLKLGSFTIPKPVFSIAPHSVSGTAKGIIVNGSLAILGNPVWSQYKLTVDYRHQRLFVQRSKAKEQYDEALADVETIELKYYRSHDAALASTQLRELAHKLEERTQLAPSAVCLARSALYSSMQLKNFNTKDTSTLPARLAAIQADFQIALTRATQTKNKEAIAEVLSANAVYLLRYSMPINTSSAKQLLLTAIENAPANTSVSMGCYWLAKQLKLKNAPLIVDQVLMAEPNNWDALWQRYTEAKSQTSMHDLPLVVEQMKRYYSGVPDVDALSITTN
jgi:hypothetical protein